MSVHTLIKFNCPYCGQEGDLVWDGDGPEPELVKLSDGFHVEKDRLPGHRHVIVCNACDQIDPPALLKLQR